SILQGYNRHLQRPDKLPVERGAVVDPWSLPLKERYEKTGGQNSPHHPACRATCSIFFLLHRGTADSMRTHPNGKAVFPAWSRDPLQDLTNRHPECPLPDIALTSR